jgi:ATP-binding cassette, subfamily B, bacterial
VEVLPGAAGRAGLVAWIAGATVVLFVLSALAIVLQRYLLAGIGGRMSAGLAEELFDHLQDMPISYHRRASTGDLVRRVSEDSDSANQMLAGVIVPLATALISLAVMAVIMFRLDPLLALLALVIAVPMGVSMWVFTRPITERSLEQYELEGQMMALAEQQLTAMPVVQSFGAEARGQEQFRTLSNQTVTAYLRRTVSELQFEVTSGVLVALGTSVVMVVGGLAVLDGRITIGTLLVFLSYLVSLYAPLEMLAGVATAYAGAGAAARRVLSVMDHPSDVVDEPGAVELNERTRGSIQFDHVYYGYDGTRAVVLDFDLAVAAGQTVAIVGETGSGKSTVLSLLLRAADPWSGTVMLDGRDVRHLRLDSLRAQVSVVFQDPYLLPISVADNIAYGRPEATFDEIVTAARDAQAEEFIQELADGYNTVLGERGVTLSGGQRQRISIARALLQGAPVLLLDEPTAAVDAETEAGLVEALERLMAGRTTILVTHRLSLIRNADVVVVMDAGRIVEMGAPSQLLADEGRFAELVRMQTGSDHRVAAKVPGR